MAAPWRVTRVEAVSDFRLRVRFVDGATGGVAMAGFLASSAVVGTVFEPLRDPTIFAGAACVDGAVTWPNGADLAPDAMYDAVRTHGEWTLE
ncbi:MAG: DUF2442 domain-containing protein [Vicinamibacteria bacterium]|nr:DUF2442 domain-containing protein [Vicinamibacteria bacterium]